MEVADVDAMVTARVPIEVKERVGAMLRDMGSSPTELVNAAYDYVLRCGKLPEVEREDPCVIRLTPEQIEDLRRRQRSLSLALDGFRRSLCEEGAS